MARERYIPQEIYTGKEFEVDLFGRFDAGDPKFLEALNRVMKPGRSGKPYVNFGDSMRLVRDFTPDPEHPKKEFLNDLRIEVVDRLGLKDTDVGAFTAVGTPLDVLHGSDAFLTLKTNGTEEVITLDASLRGEKISGEYATKADLLVTGVPTPEEKDYLEKVGEYADKIVQILKKRRRSKSGGYRAEAAE